MTEKKTYVSAEAEVILFDNSDVITTSGCKTWSSANGYTCHGGLQQVTDRPPLS